MCTAQVLLIKVCFPTYSSGYPVGFLWIINSQSCDEDTKTNIGLLSQGQTMSVHSFVRALGQPLKILEEWDVVPDVQSSRRGGDRLTINTVICTPWMWEDQASVRDKVFPRLYLLPTPKGGRFSHVTPSVRMPWTTLKTCPKGAAPQGLVFISQGCGVRLCLEHSVKDSSIYEWENSSFIFKRFLQCFLNFFLQLCSSICEKMFFMISDLFVSWFLKRTLYDWEANKT